jgi:hypothetical protein
LTWRESLRNIGTCLAARGLKLDHRGTSPNAGRTQIRIAIAVPLLAGILEKRLHPDLSLHAVLRFLRLALFERAPILQVFSRPPPSIQLPGAQSQPCSPEFLTGQQ